MDVLRTPLRPLADLLDLTAEAVAAIGTLSVDALGVLLADSEEYPPLRAVDSSPN